MIARPFKFKSNQNRLGDLGFQGIALNQGPRLLVGLPGLLCRTALGITVAELRNVAVVVCLHLLVEDLGLAAAGLRDKLAIQEGKDGVADRLKLVLFGRKWSNSKAQTES